MNSCQININILVIHVLFGKIPKWFPYFLKSCRYNASLDFLIVTDSKEIFNDENIQTVHMSKEDFSSLCLTNIGIRAKMKDPYKICDFKPAFGEIFKEYLNGYDYWAYCDNDLIIGDVNNFLPKEVIYKYDIISLYKDFMSGPLCIYKNQNDINSLYRKAKNYERMLESDKHFAFDENVFRINNKGVSIRKMKLLFRFISNRTIEFKTIRQLKFDFQWYVKKNQLLEEQTDPMDMTEVVWKFGNDKRILFHQYLLSDSDLQRAAAKNWVISWDNGKLVNCIGHEIMAFHFLRLKTKKIYIEELSEGKKCFKVTPIGIFG